jgi:amino acid adenylation domain-containing protein
MSLSSESLAGLSLAEKRMLLAKLLKEKAQQDPPVYPLAHGQRGLWFLYQMDRASAAYNLFFPTHIRSPLDVAAFRRALQTLLDRHPALRTTFEERDGELLQRVHENVPLHLEVVDASAWSDEALRERVEEEAHRPFDLEHGPLVRMHLFARAPEDHVYLVTAHHIVGDFWSLVLLMEEMQALYPALRDGRPLSLSPARCTYRDFVRWQADMLAGAEGERLRSYWERQLAGVPAALDLPTDRPRPSRFTHHGLAVPCELGADLTRRLKALASAEGVTPYTVLLSAFQVLLGRYSRQDDFVVGSPFAGRSRPEFEQVVGYFIYMLPLRANLAGDPPFRTLLHQTGSTVLQALQHQDYPFPLLVERSNLKRDPSRPPLVQALFTLEKAHRRVGASSSGFFLPGSGVRLNVGGLRGEPYPLRQRSCQGDLEMVLEEDEGGIYGMLRGNADLFEEETIRRMVGHYRTLLVNALRDPDRRLSELPLLTEAERRQVLSEWNETGADYPRDLCLHHLFEQQAKRVPDAVALRFQGQTTSYGELNRRANRLAHRLHRLGVGRNSLVALCLERSPDMMTAILAVLKAGGAFVPLDPSSPVERLRAILDDTRAPVLLTQSFLADRLSALKIETIALDEDDIAPGDDAESTHPPQSGVQPDDLAYVIYTSGSTGQPKGVMIEHRAICNTICWHQDVLTLRADDRLLLAVPYFFDASISLIFPALAGGAQLVLADPGEERDPPRLVERIGREGVTILPVLPRILQLMLEGPIREAGRTLRMVCCGGEAMPPELPAQVFKLLDVELYNHYGPTEAAVDVTCWACPREEDRPMVPIGRPITNVQVYVLDRHRQPLPVGVPGELYIGGAGLARGYLNDVELTAERFLPDPFRGVPGSRLYRTGDRCRWLADGVLEFLGRLDQQVKVRGHRIEIGEIEAALQNHPAVSEAAVTLHPEGVGGARLVAYIAALSGEENRAIDAESLRAHLQERLPQYMVPSAFLLLDELPHTSTGKLDRAALPAPPAPERPTTGQPYVAPRTALEEFLAGLWRDVLRVEQIGALDNFFELGGNSIQAAVFINRLQEKLSQPIYTVAVFDSPTIADLARYLSEVCPTVLHRLFGPESIVAADGSASQPASASRSPLLALLQTEGTRPPCFMVHPPGGIVVCYQALAQRLGRERPFYAIRARGLSGEPDLPTSMEEMAAEYVAAIRSVCPHGPYHLGGWSLGGVIAYEMAQQLRTQGESVGLLALLDTTIPTSPINQAYAEDAELSAREYGLDLTLEELDRLHPNEQLPYLWDHVHKLGLVDTDTPLSLVQQILDDLKRLFHVHVTLANEYALRPYAGRITLFRPSDSPILSSSARDRNWGKLASSVEVHFVPGLHHTIVKEPHVQSLAHELRRCLRDAESAMG